MEIQKFANYLTEETPDFPCPAATIHTLLDNVGILLASQKNIL